MTTTRRLQAIPKHSIQADVRNPDQAHFTKQGASRVKSESAQQSWDYVAVHRVIGDVRQSVRPHGVRQQSQIRNKEEAREEHLVMRKQQGECTTRGEQGTESLSLQKVHGAGEERLNTHN